MLKTRNKILAAALEELMMEEKSSTADVTSTDLVDVDAVAELQNELEESSNAAMESDLISLTENGAALDNDIEAAMSAADALEEYSRVAFAAARDGGVNKYFNASMAVGIEAICAQVDYPSIVAAVEDNSEDITDVKENAKALGERASEAARKILDGVMAFIKRIREMAKTFITRVMEYFNPLHDQVKKLKGEISKIDESQKIEDEAFIKSMNLVSNDPNADFTNYAKFANNSISLLCSKDLKATAAALMRNSANDEELRQLNYDMVSILTSKIFTRAGHGNKVGGTAYSPKLIGGTVFELEYVSNSVTTTSISISVSKEETVAPSSIDVAKISNARAMLESIAVWSKDINNINKAIESLTADITTDSRNIDDYVSVRRQARVFTTTITALSTVLTPAVLRHNVWVARKYISYVKKSLAAKSKD